jgi:hypothetical protein
MARISFEDIVQHLRRQTGSDQLELSTFRDNVRLVVPREHLYSALEF